MPKILKVFYLRILLNFILQIVRILTRHRAFFSTVTALFSMLTASFAQSALQSGTWAKVSVTESGIYKITYEDLAKWGFSDINSVAVYGNGAGPNSLMNTADIPDTLHPIAISVVTGNDAVFNSGDYILFYGQSPNVWTFDANQKTFSHIKNRLSDKNYYFITTNKKTAIISESESSDAATTSSNSYDNLQFYEKDDVNPISSGQNYFESVSSEKSVQFSTPYALSNATATIAFAARHSSQANVSVTINDESMESLLFSPTNSNKPYARLLAKTFSFSPKEKNSITLKLKYSGASSRGYLDYVELRTRCALQIDGNEQLIFRDVESISNGICSYTIRSSSSRTIWDITNPEQPIALKSSFTNGSTQFSADCSTLHEFIAFSKDFKSVNFEKIIDNQDILKNTNIDMLIIANPMFNEQANRLAQLHTTFDKFTCAVVSQEEICTEFAAGRKDVAALRDYIRYIYIRGGKKLKYVLLFGDGTFANKTIDFNGPYIFTFQTKETLNEDYSLCSDDFFGLLDKNSGVKSNDTFVGELKVAIGRLPVTTKSEAEHITDKIIQYSTNPLYRGDWQNYLCFLADDANENQTTHMNDADLLCTSITKSYPQFNFDKIYADAYKQVRSSAGERYPDVVKAINDRIQKGCLIFNYSGHGNETRMMAEYAVEATAVESWKNTTKLPFFIAAACNIAHFDYNGTSLGEKLLTQKNGGGIGIISATRYSYASANYTLCDNIYKYIFDLDTLQQPRTIGEAFLLAKANTANDMYQNKRVYILLGDPALRLAVPKYSIAIDSINNIPFAEFNDTIKALSTLQISGHIETPDAQIDDKYDGILSIKLFDKSQSITTLGNDKNDVITFDSYTNTLFQGMASVQNGRFSFSAILPQDIYYYNGKGKLSLYATNDSIQAAGAFYDLLINESLTSEDDDFSGPTISMYLNEKNFTNGSMTNQNPTLRIFVTDSSGINISNASIGHSITLTIDGDESNQITLNDFYYADLNTYTSGSIEYKLLDLAEGEHTLTLTMWDSYNNPSEMEINFYVVNSKDVTIKNVYNYPNPMKDITYFHFAHNQAGNEAKITIKIYDLSGNLVRSFVTEKTASGFLDTELFWDGKSANGSQMQNGIYPYTIEIQTNTGETQWSEQKILLVK